MPNIDPMAIIAIVLVAVMAVLCLLPTERSARRGRKRKANPEKEAKDTDWQAVSLKLERHLYALRRDIDDRKKREIIMDKELTIQKERYSKLQDKLGQERGWQKKEKGEIEKKTKNALRLKDALRCAEQQLAKEHGDLLRLGRELKAAQSEAAAANDAKLSLETEVARIQNMADGYRKDITELRETNNKLAKKRDDVTFVAKADYEELQQKLRRAEKEVEVFRERLRKGIS